MKTTTKLLTGLLALSLAAPLLAAKAKKEKAAAPDPAMAQAIKYGTPGEGHKVLDRLIGNFAFSVKHWMAPDGPAQESKGTTQNNWVLGGRFLKQEVKGDMAGQPFEGVGYTGFNNVSGEYQSTWIDNMSTGMMEAKGTYDPATKTIKETGTFSCGMSGEKNRPMRAEWKILDNDNSTYTSYMNAPDGKEFKAMEIVYNRVK